MGAIGCIVAGGVEKTRKKGFKMLKQACFGMHDPSGKTQEHDRYSCGDQRVARGVIEGKRGICSVNKMHLGMGKKRKQTGGRQKYENERAQNDAVH